MLGNTKTGDRPIHIAAKEKETDVIKVLVESGADVNALNNKGQTARKNKPIWLHGIILF